MNELCDLTDEVQELAWAVVDEQATESQIQHLEELLLENDDARRVYVMCMQMHADLHYLLGGNKRFHLPIEIQETKETKATQKMPLPLVDLSPVGSIAAMSEVGVS